MGKFSDWFWGVEPEQPVVETRAEPELPVSEPLAIPSRAELPVTDGTLLRTIAVYRAVQLLCLGVSQLTLDVWRGDDLIEKPSLAKRPDIKTRDLAMFLKRTTASLALTGNAYWRLTRNARNEVSNIETLNPHECWPLDNGELSISGLTRNLKPYEFQHLGLLWVPGELKALGPIQAARVELTGAVKTVTYGSEFHDSGDVPSGILKTDQVLSETQAAAYKAKWMTRAAHEVAVLGQGLNYSPILLSPADAQFIETRQFDTTAIARLFGIPAHLFLAAVEGSSLTYSNLAQADLAFVRWSLAEYTREIQTAFSACLPNTQTARFNLDAVLRSDTKSRYEAHALGIQAGWLKKNEVRVMEGLKPIPGLDETKPVPAPAPTPEPVQDEEPNNE